MHSKVRPYASLQSVFADSFYGCTGLVVEQLDIPPTLCEADLNKPIVGMQKGIDTPEPIQRRRMLSVEEMLVFLVYEAVMRMV